MDEDIILRSVRFTREQLEEITGQAEEYVRENPGQALLYAFVAGYVLNRLPLMGVMRGLVRLSLFAVKPAVLIYGATKLYQAVQE
jgi:predicted nucleic-acid-binding protein